MTTEAPRQRSGRKKHSYVPFYFDDWNAGTADMPRLVQSVYFQICKHNWDKALPVSEGRLVVMLSDLPPGQGDKIVDVLIEDGKLVRDVRGVHSPRALEEAEIAMTLWEKKSSGGKARAAKHGSSTPANTAQENHSIPEPELDREGSPPLANGEPLADEGEPEKAEPAGDPPKAAKARPTAAQCAEVVGAWNVMAAANGLAQAVKMTGAREGAARVRLEEMGLEQLVEAINLVPQRPFLMGKNERKWKADLDWFLRPNSAAAVLEGSKYTDAKGSAWRDME